MTADTLPVIAGKINAFLDKAAKADEYRISAGVLLIEARARIDAREAGDVSWADWCRGNVKRSGRDIRRVMKLAGATDPAGALRQERAEAQRRMADHRANVRPVEEGSPLDVAKAAIERMLDPEQGLAFIGWIVSEYPWLARAIARKIAGGALPVATSPVPAEVPAPPAPADPPSPPQAAAPVCHNGACRYGSCHGVGRCLAKPAGMAEPARTVRRPPGGAFATVLTVQPATIP